MKPPRWQALPPADESLTAAIAAEAGLSPILASIVARRTGSLEAARKWLRPLDVPLCDPMALGGMAEAVARIQQALAHHEPITVYGDYDTDGITATTLLVNALQSLGATVKPFFPDRATEGYGLTPAAVQRCLTYPPKPKLIITVDCGITSVDEVAWLAEQGVETVVTDHHLPPAVLPNAISIVNPRLSAPLEAREMCGCATAFTLVRALAQAGAPLNPETFLDLVAVASIADVMELTGDNRTLVVQGLRAMSTAKPGNAGLRALLRALKLPAKPGEALTSERLAFAVVPCINAAGRLGQLKKAWLLLGMGRPEAAPQLLSINEERRTLERALTAELLEQLESEPPAANPGTQVLLCHNPAYAGVLGIAAARIMELVGRPVAILCADEVAQSGHGSMRACGAWHAVSLLDSVKDLLVHYGGHAAAAGFAVRPGALGEFVARLSQTATGPAEEMALTYDADLSYLPITLSLCKELTILEPCGNGNRQPVFRKGFTIDSLRAVGADGTHLSLRLLPDDGGPALKAIWFSGAAHAAGWHVGDTLQALFTLEVDTFREPCPALRIVDATVV